MFLYDEAAMAERRDLARGLLLLFTAALLTRVSPQLATPSLPELSAAKLVYSYSSSARISRGITADLSAEVSRP